MRTQDLILPALGMAQDSGVIVDWFKKPGDWVEEDEPFMAVETDKAVMDIPAPAAGRLTQISGAVNTPIAVGTVVAVLTCPENEEEKEQLLNAEFTAADAAPATAATAEIAAAVSAPVPEPDIAADAAGNDSGLAAVLTAATPTRADTEPVCILASPKARQLAGQHQLELAQLERHPQLEQPFTAADVLTFISWKSKQEQQRAHEHIVEVTLKLDKFSQLLAWLAEQGDWRPLHLWTRINQRLLTRENWALGEVPLVGELVQGQLNFYRIDTAQSTLLPTLTSSPADEGRPPIFLGCVVDQHLSNCSMLAADWSVTLFHHHAKAILRSSVSQYTLQQTLDYGQKLVDLIANPLPFLL